MFLPGHSLGSSSATFSESQSSTSSPFWSLITFQKLPFLESVVIAEAEIVDGDWVKLFTTTIGRCTLLLKLMKEQVKAFFLVLHLLVAKTAGEVEVDELADSCLDWEQPMLSTVKGGILQVHCFCNPTSSKLRKKNPKKSHVSIQTPPRAKQAKCNFPNQAATGIQTEALLKTPSQLPLEDEESTPFTTKKKCTDLTWTEQDMAKALEARENRLSLRKCAMQFGISRFAITNWEEGRAQKKKKGPPTQMSSEDKDALLNGYLERMYFILQRIPGKSWWDSFCKRHPSLVFRVSEGLDQSRANNFKPDIVGSLHKNLQELYEKHPYPSTNVWNANETGFQGSRDKEMKVFAKKGAKAVYGITCFSNPMHDVGSVHDTKAKGKAATENPLNAMPAATDTVKASQQRGASVSASASGETLKTMASASVSALRKSLKTNSTEDLQEVGVNMPTATETVKTSLQASVSGSALRESLKTQTVNTALQTMPSASASASASRESLKTNSIEDL
ncbi:hypothetical protein L7F22_052119 [Adiantum nelumboides]|nr:hypothetical protein [Adiantum nelumboides]